MFSIRLHQFLNLIALIVLLLILDTWRVDLVWFGIAIAFAATIETWWFRYSEDRVYFPFSALVSAMGVFLILYSAKGWIYLVLIFLALGQKYLFRRLYRPLFNPSNFAVVLGLWLFPASVALRRGHLGDDYVLIAAVTVLGALLLYRAKRFIIPLAFVALYIPLGFYIASYHEIVLSFDMYIWRFVSVSFAVFVLLMLTDPKTTPSSGIGQTVFGVSVALGALALDWFSGPSDVHVFLALFVLTPLYALINARGFHKERVLLAVAASFLVIGAVAGIEKHELIEAEFGA